LGVSGRNLEHPGGCKQHRLAQMTGQKSRKNGKQQQQIWQGRRKLQHGQAN